MHKMRKIVIDLPLKYVNIYDLDSEKREIITHINSKLKELSKVIAEKEVKHIDLGEEDVEKIYEKLDGEIEGFTDEFDDKYFKELKRDLKEKINILSIAIYRNIGDCYESETTPSKQFLT